MAQVIPPASASALPQALRLKLSRVIPPAPALPRALASELAPAPTHLTSGPKIPYSSPSVAASVVFSARNSRSLALRGERLPGHIRGAVSFSLRALPLAPG